MKKRFNSTTTTKDNLYAYFFLMPVTVIVTWLMAVPIIKNFIASFSSKIGTHTGLANYAIILNNNHFFQNVMSSIVYVICSLILIIPTGLLAAHLITDNSKFVRILRPIYLISWIIPPICSSIIFRTMFNEYGFVTYILRMIFPGKQVVLLVDPTLAMLVLIVHVFWRALPFAMLFFAAGLTTIPNALYESFTLDGATRWQQFIYLTMPLLMPHMFMVSLMITNGLLQEAESFYAITGGGPGRATEPIALRVFNNTFITFDMASASILGVVMLVIACVFIFLYGRIMGSMEEDIYE